MKRIRILAYVLMIIIALTITSNIKINASDSEQIDLIETIDDFNRALTNASDGDTLYVGDIEFPYANSASSMKMINKSLTIIGGKETKSIFTNPMFSIYGKEASDFLNVSFKNIEFRGNLFNVPFDSENTPNVSSKGMNMLKTMFAFIFDRNVNLNIENCLFEGYHYGYGGIFSATKYSNADNTYQLHIKLDDCIFQNNYSHHGGIAYLYGHDVDLLSIKARNCVFKNNYSATGGVIYAIKSSVCLFNCVISDNKFLDYDMTAEKNGGALALYNCDTNIEACVINNNETGNYGAAIYAEIVPFKALKIKNTTIVGNNGSSDEGLCVKLGESNLETSAKAYIGLSTIIGKQEFNDNVETFACLLSGDNNIEASSNNKYNQYITLDKFNELNYDSSSNEHLNFSDCIIPQNEYNHYYNTNENNNVRYYAGDNYHKDVKIKVYYSKKNVEEITINYGESITLEEPTRKGYTFKGWDSYDSEYVYMGGDVSNIVIKANWKFNVLDNWYYTILPLVNFFFIMILVIYFIRHGNHRKKKEEALATTNNEIINNNNNNDPNKDWIESACNNPNIVALLSTRELEVMEKLLRGLSRKQISDELFISEATVKKHCGAIYEKFGVKNRSELVYKITKEY